MSCVPRRNFCAAALLLCSLLGLDSAGAAVLACPVNAPPEWKAGQARLDHVRMAVYMPGRRSGTKTLSGSEPDSEWETGGVLFQSWKLKKGLRIASYQVDCLYTGTTRIVRFDPRSAGRCIATRPVRKDALLAGALEFRCR